MVALLSLALSIQLLAQTPPLPQRRPPTAPQPQAGPDGLSRSDQAERKVETAVVPNDCNLKTMCEETVRAQESTPAHVQHEANRTDLSERRDEARIQRLEKQVRDRMEAAFLKGRPRSQLSRAEKYSLEAMQATRIPKLSKSSKQCRFSCTMGGLAQISDGEVCVCPRVEQYDDEFIMFILAHEFAHAGDLCSFSRTKLAPGAHPYELGGTGGSVVQCLQLIGIPSALPGEAARLDQRFKNQDSLWQRILGTGTHAEFRTLTQGHHHCFGRHGNSNMREATADLFAMEVVGLYLKDKPPPRKPGNLRRLFGIFAETGCQKTKGKREYEGHPNDLDRVAKIGLSLPAYREALNCKSHTANLNCEYQPEGSKPSVSSPATVR